MNIFLAEFFGTMVLILFGCGVVAGVCLEHSKSKGAGWLAINIGWGLAVSMAIYLTGNISGSHLNPAVTTGLALIGKFEWAKVPGYVIAQFLGAMTGAKLVYFMYLKHWKETNDQNIKLGVFSNMPAIPNVSANLVTEVIGTFGLMLCILGIGANNISSGINPLLIGLLVVGVGLSFGGPTGYAVNPARDLGPRIMHAILPIPGKGSSGWSYSWIPVVGPMIGGSYAALFYQAFFEGQIDMLFYIGTFIILALFSWAYFEREK